MAAEEQERRQEERLPGRLGALFRLLRDAENARDSFKVGTDTEALLGDSVAAIKSAITSVRGPDRLPDPRGW